MAKARCNYVPVVFDTFTETAFCFRQSNSLTRFHWVDKQARDNANLLVAFRSALFPKQNSGSNYNSGRQREEKKFSGRQREQSRVGRRHSQGVLLKGCPRRDWEIVYCPRARYDTGAINHLGCWENTRRALLLWNNDENKGVCRRETWFYIMIKLFILFTFIGWRGKTNHRSD